MQFTVHYDEAVVRSAVNTFVKRRIAEGMGRGGLMAAVVTLAVWVYLLWQGDRSWFVGAIGAILMVFVLIFARLWRWRHVEMRRKLAAIPSRQTVVTLSEDGIAFDSEAGAMTLPWTTFTELWRLERCWLLFLEPNNFVTLPIDGVPQDALDFIEQRVAPST
ncbi:MAG: YcxB family protein [Hyphomicrobiaceae bacterium]